MLPEDSIERIMAQLMLIHPISIFGLMFIAILGWAILLEIWLSELPNQIIGSACIQLQYFLKNPNHGTNRTFENYRIITTFNPESITQGVNGWNLIDKRQMEDGKWRCLVNTKLS